jgi:hypothetical protein
MTKRDISLFLKHKPVISNKNYKIGTTPPPITIKNNIMCPIQAIKTKLKLIATNKIEIEGSSVVKRIRF